MVDYVFLYLISQNPSHLMLLKISANYSLLTSSYKFALGQLLRTHPS